MLREYEQPPYAGEQLRPPVLTTSGRALAFAPRNSGRDRPFPEDLMRTAYLSSFTYVNFLVLFVLTCGSYAQPVKTKILDPRYGNVPLSFELNRGQAPEGVQFLARDAR